MRAMSDQTPRWQTAAGVAAYCVIVVVPLVLAGAGAMLGWRLEPALIAGLPIVILLFLASLMAGAWTIIATVRKINRRDDPRHTKTPPDNP